MMGMAPVADEAEKLLALLAEGEREWRNPGKLTLAHYTRCDAVKAIVTEGDGLKAHRSDLPADPGEGTTTAAGQKLVEALEEQDHSSWVYRKFRHAYLTCFVGGEENDPELQGVDIEDDLLFWRLYGDNCTGASIKLPESMVRRVEGMHTFGAVTYRSTTDANKASRGGRSGGIVSTLTRLHEEHTSTGDWDGIYKKVGQAVERYMAQRFLEKHAHYRAEREYRLVVFPDPSSKGSPDDEWTIWEGGSSEELNVTGTIVTFGCRAVEYPDLEHEVKKELGEGSGGRCAIKFQESNVKYRP